MIIADFVTKFLIFHARLFFYSVFSFCFSFNLFQIEKKLFKPHNCSSLRFLFTCVLLLSIEPFILFLFAVPKVCHIMTRIIVYCMTCPWVLSISSFSTFDSQKQLNTIPAPPPPLFFFLSLSSFDTC